MSFDGVAVSCSLPEELPAFNRLALGTPIGKKVLVVALRDGKERTFELATVVRGQVKAVRLVVRGNDHGTYVWDLVLTEVLLIDDQ